MNTELAHQNRCPIWRDWTTNWNIWAINEPWDEVQILKLISIYIEDEVLRPCTYASCPGIFPARVMWKPIIVTIRVLTKRLRLTPESTKLEWVNCSRSVSDLRIYRLMILSSCEFYNCLAICHQRSSAHACLFSCCHQRYRAIWSREEHGEHQSW